MCCVSLWFYNLLCLLPVAQDTGCTLLLCVVSAFDFIICFASCLLCKTLASVSAFDFIICFATCLLCKTLAVHYLYVLCQPLILLFVLPLAFSARHWLYTIFMCCVSLWFYNLLCLLPVAQDTGCTLLLAALTAFDFIICFATCLLCKTLAAVSAFDFIICFATCLLCKTLAAVSAFDFIICLLLAFCARHWLLCQPLIL